jgi:hypothetical protein
VKKEVTVCDAPDCRRLADCVCPICERDFCRDHRKAFVEAVITNKRQEPRPNDRPAPPGNPSEPFFTVNNERSDRVEMCNGCWSDCGDVERSASNYSTRSMFSDFTPGVMVQLTEIIRAKIAERKLTEKK